MTKCLIWMYLQFGSTLDVCVSTTWLHRPGPMFLPHCRALESGGKLVKTTDASAQPHRFWLGTFGMEPEYLFFKEILHILVHQDVRAFDLGQIVLLFWWWGGQFLVFRITAFMEEVSERRNTHQDVCLQGTFMGEDSSSTQGSHSQAAKPGGHVSTGAHETWPRLPTTVVD